MKIHYLGTAASEGCPALFCSCALCMKAKHQGGRDRRTRSQVLIDGELLVDFPPDTYLHYLDTPSFHLNLLQHVLITHSHADHFYPQDLARRCADFAQGLETVLTVYGNQTVKEAWDVVRHGEFFSQEDLDAFVRFQVMKPFEPVAVGAFTVTALPANHKKDELCFIFDIEKNGKRMLYANDTGIMLQPEVWQYFSERYFDLLSMDCTAMDRRVGRNHMGLPDNEELIHRLRTIGAVDEHTRFIATHFSHFGALTHEELNKRAGRSDILCAYDGMEITL